MALVFRRDITFKHAFKQLLSLARVTGDTQHVANEPIRNEHVHFFVPEAAIPQIQAWYAKNFGAKPSSRNTAQFDDIPGVQLRFNKTDPAATPTKGRVLDHIGFDVKDLPGFIKKLEAAGIKLDRPYTKNEQTGAALAFITDPWGTYIELNERPNPVYLP